jgi:hypothetical protein
MHACVLGNSNLHAPIWKPIDFESFDSCLAAIPNKPSTDALLQLSSGKCVEPNLAAWLGMALTHFCNSSFAIGAVLSGAEQPGHTLT